MEDLSIHSTTAARGSAPVQNIQNMRPLNKESQGQPNREEAAKKAAKAAQTINASKLVKQANAHVKVFSTKVEFGYNPQNKESFILVTDKDTGKVIRKIPPEKMVDLMKKMEEIAGIIYNEEA